MQNLQLTPKTIRWAVLAVPLVWLVIVSLPEVMRDRIYPFDSALIAANGALFQSLFAHLGEFLAAPGDWLWGYYEQYPALSVRRHPPLFGLLSGVVYSVGGVSASAAKFTVMLFACGLAVGVFFVARRTIENDLLAGCAALLVVATPQFSQHFYTVWLDVPSLAFATWAVYFYIGRLQGDTSVKNVLGIVAFAVLAMYTYQPVIMLLAGVFFHLLAREFTTFYKDRSIWIGVATLIVLMLPLVVFTLYFARDNLLATTGEIPSSWKEFDSPTYGSWLETDKLSIAYWTEYARIILVSFPVQVAGLCIWGASCWFRRPSRAETLMLVCLLVTYFAFSWLVVKGPRYTLYMMLPATILTVVGLHAVSQRLLGKGRRALSTTAGVLAAAALAQANLVSIYTPYTFLSGLDQPIRDILDEDPGARILYSGRNDAAFVFYTRSLDEQGGASVARASVQVELPTDLETYVDQEHVNYVVVEIANPAYDSLEIIDQFRDAIVAFGDGRADFENRREYELPYGIDVQEGQVTLRVYARQR